MQRHFTAQVRLLLRSQPLVFEAQGQQSRLHLAHVRVRHQQIEIGGGPQRQVVVEHLAHGHALEHRRLDAGRG